MCMRVSHAWRGRGVGVASEEMKVEVVVWEKMK